MRNKTIMISERQLMFVVAGQLFDQAPNRQPRKAETIMQKLRDAFRSESYNDNEFYTVHVEQEDLYEWIKDKLFSIQEFQELNLTQEEYDKGISVDDESRPKYCFTTRYDVYDSESWKRDFIDLDAFVQNVHRMLLNIIDIEEDCFCCIHQDKTVEPTLDCGKSDLCKECSVNPNLKNHYEGCRQPRGKYTFACKYNCFKNRYICCEECDEKDNCIHRCDAESKSCGNAMN
ncbi:hypothetical protein ACQRBH_05925 [Bariatricus sp. SGI.161]|uniref:hypothetical protein n=1 Tax=Bariatricus sp. SGI.161 TaxID=3420550 RepID=UPI003D0399A9